MRFRGLPEVAVLMCAALPVFAVAYHIRTVAGAPPDSPPAPAAWAQPLGDLNGIAADRWGNVYVSDTDHHRVCRIAPDGAMSTYAGNGYAGYAGDGGAAGAAQLQYPYGLAVDPDGNLYIADLGNDRVRRVGLDGIIRTVAGTGHEGYGGDGGPGLKADLTAPRSLALDQAGNVYIAEFYGHRIRRLGTDGIVTTVAGTGAAGYSGDGGPAAVAQIAFPAGMAFDSSGNLYFADSQNRAIRRVTWAGIIFTVAGGPDSAEVATPSGLAVDTAGNLYFSDQSATVRAISRQGWTVRIAGTGQQGSLGDGGTATDAQLAAPRDLALDGAGNLLIADGQRARRVEAGRIVTLSSPTPVAYSAEPPSALAARLRGPAGLAWDSAGDLFVAEAGGHRIRRILPSGEIVTAAGTGAAGFSGDGAPAPDGVLNAPAGLALDSAGTLLIADSANQRLRAIDAAGLIRTAAGGPLADPVWSSPAGVVSDPSGDVYVADAGGHRVLLVRADGSTSVVAGTGVAGFSGDGGPATGANLDNPSAVALDAAGLLYIADTGNHRIRTVDAAGRISTVAGPDQVQSPAGLAFSGGLLYVADSGNHRIRVLAPDGAIETIAGQGSPGFEGDSGPALSALLDRPTGIAVDTSGNVYFSDTGNDRVRELVPDGPVVPPKPVEEPAAAGVVHGATLQPGPVAPGEIVSLFAPSLGPEEAQTGAGGPDGRLQTSAGEATVLFDGEPAPIFYAGRNQINAQVPYSVASRAETRVEAWFQGVLRARATVAVAASAPGIFAAEAGKGPALALNQDGTLNTPVNPAARGSIVTFFATGEGQTDPPSASGFPAGPPLGKPRLPVMLSIGNASVDLEYAGSAPGLVGVMQINARVPAAFLPPGALPVVLTVGAASSPSGVTLFVK